MPTLRATGLVLGLAGAALIVGAAPAWAYYQNGPDGHHGHYDHYGHGRPHGPPPRYAPRYYAPPPVYYAPPQAYYAPPPVYYGGPGASITFSIP